MKATKIGLFIIVWTLVLLTSSESSAQQVIESSFSPDDLDYAFSTDISNRGAHYRVTAGTNLYNVYNTGGGGAKEGLWSELHVRHDGELYRFQQTRYGPSGSQVALWDVGQVYEMGDLTPFTLKAELTEKNDEAESGSITLSIMPDSGMPSCGGNMPLMLRHTYQPSYLMCDMDGRPLMLRFEFTNTHGGQIDNPGYAICVREGGGFKKFAEFGERYLNSHTFPISVADTGATLQMTLRERVEGSRYDGSGSNWSVALNE